MLTEVSKPIPELDEPNIVVKPLVDLWLHQNTLMWSRVRLLSILQASALVANYVLKNPFASVGICAIAIVATLYLNYIWEVDREIRNSYNVRLRTLGFKIGLTPDERRALRVRVVGVQIPTKFNAQNTLIGIFWALIALDALVLVTSVAAWSN